MNKLQNMLHGGGCYQLLNRLIPKGRLFLKFSYTYKRTFKYKKTLDVESIISTFSFAFPIKFKT